MNRIFLERAWPGALVWAIGGVCMLALPTVLDRYSLHVLALSGLYVIFTFGLLLVLGFTGEFMVGYAGLVGVGAYTSAILATKFGLDFWVALPSAVLMTVVAALIVGSVAIRFSGHFVAVVTLAFNILIYNVLLNWIDVTRGTQGISDIPMPSALLGVEIGSRKGMYLAIWTLVTACAIGLHLLRRSPWGYAMIAVRDDAQAAAANGIRSNRVRLWAYAASGVFAGVGGSLYAHYSGIVEPYHFDFPLSVSILAMLLIGGKNSVLGAALGALLLSTLPEFLRVIGDYRWLIYSSILVLAMLVLPGGLVQAWARLSEAASRLVGSRKDRSPHLIASPREAP